jgi:uncharacterized protein (TIGR02996 family)
VARVRPFLDDCGAVTFDNLMAEPLQQALELWQGGRREQALARLLGAWAKRPLPALGDVIDTLAASLPRPDGDELGQLREGTLDDIGDRVAALGRRGRDPRLASALMALVRDVPYTSNGSRPTWTIILRVLGEQGDPRLLASLPSVATSWGIRENQRAWLAPRVATLLETVRAQFPDGGPQPSATEAAWLAQLAALTGAGPQPRRADTPRTADELLAGIYANPDDDGPRAVYADWLQEQKDPADVARGEFIASQLAPARDKKMLAREKQLLDQYGRAWLGPLEPVVLKQGVAFARGFLAACHARFKNEREARAHGAHAAWATVERLTHSVPGAPPQDQLRWLYHIDPAMKSLREVELEDAGVRLLCAATTPWPLERLGLRVNEAETFERLATTEQLPRLRALAFLRASEMPPRGWLARARLGAELRELSLTRVGRDKSLVLPSWIGEAEKLPRLERLLVDHENWTITRDGDGELSIFAGLVRYSRLPFELADDAVTAVSFALRDEKVKPGDARWQSVCAELQRMAARFTRLHTLDLRGYGGELVTFKPTATRRAALPTVTTLPLGQIGGLAWPAREQVVAAGELGLVWFDAQRGARLRVVEGVRAPLAAAPDGAHLAALDGGLALFDGPTGERRAAGAECPAWAVALELSPDSKRVAALTRDKIFVFDVASGRLVCKRGAPRSPRQLAWDAHGEKLLVTTQGPTFAIEPDSKRRPVALDGDEAYAVATRADGRIALAPWGPGHVRLRDGDGKELARWPCAGQVRWPRFVDASLLLLSEIEGLVWQPLDGGPARTLVAHEREARVTAVALGPEGADGHERQLAVAVGARIEIRPLSGAPAIRTLT